MVEYLVDHSADWLECLLVGLLVDRQVGLKAWMTAEPTESYLVDSMASLMVSVSVAPMEPYLVEH